MLFAYTAVDREGKKLSAEIEAIDRSEAVRQIRSRGHQLIDLRERAVREQDKMASGTVKPGLTTFRPTLVEMMMFCNQMESLTKGGVPLLQAVNSLIPFIQGRVFKAILEDVVEQLQGGYSLSQALSKHQYWLPELMTGMLRAGEETGNMEAVFGRLAQYFENEKKTRDRVGNVMRYPIILTCTAIAAMLILNVLVVPVFASIFTRYGAELPLMTHILMTTSAIIIQHWDWVIIALCLSFFGVKRIYEMPAGRLWWDEKKLKIPVFGSMMHRITLARTCHSVAMIFASGMPIIQGLSIAGNTTANKFFIQQINQMSDDLSGGSSLTAAAQRSRLFHPLAMQMMVAGEESGSIDTTLSRVAVFYDGEIDNEITSLSQKIEPFIVAAMGAMVLVLALGIFLPLWDMSAVILGRQVG